MFFCVCETNLLVKLTAACLYVSLVYQGPYINLVAALGTGCVWVCAAWCWCGLDCLVVQPN